MLNKRIEKALNAQINKEFWSGYLYLSMSAHFAKDGKMGFSNWFKVQALEEQDHAMKLFDYIVARGGEVHIQPIKEVPQSWETPLSAFESTLEHEKIVTASIDDIMNIAHDEKDYASVSLLRWFVDEQVQEETTASEYIDSLKMIGNDGFGIYTIDKELKSRVYTPLNASNSIV